MSKKNKRVLTLQIHRNYLLILIVIGFLLGGFLWFNSKVDNILNSQQNNKPTVAPLIATPTSTSQVKAQTPSQLRTAVVLPYNGKIVYCVSNHAEEVRQAAQLVDSKSKELLNNFSQQGTKCLDDCRKSSDQFRTECINSTPQGQSQTPCYEASGNLYKSCGQRCIDTAKKQKDDIPNQLKPYSDSVTNLINEYCKS